MSNEDLIKALSENQDSNVIELVKRFTEALEQLRKPQLYSREDVVSFVESKIEQLGGKVLKAIIPAKKDIDGWDIEGNIKKFDELSRELDAQGKVLTGDPEVRRSWKVIELNPNKPEKPVSLKSKPTNKAKARK